MAIIKCSECGKEISDKAKTCINCGNPIFQEKIKTINKMKWEDLGYEEKNKIIAYRKTLKQWWDFNRILPILVIMIFFVFLMLFTFAKLNFTIMLFIIAITFFVFICLINSSSKEQKKWYEKNIDKIYENEILK